MLNRSKARSHFVLQLIGVGYVAYLMAGIVKTYLNGTENIPFALFVLIMLVMAAAEIFLLLSAVRNWKRDRQKENEQENEGSE